MSDPVGLNDDGTSEIFLFRADSNDVIQLTDSSGHDNLSPDISDDGSRIVFTSTADLTGANPNLSSELFLFDVPTATFVQVTSNDVEFDRQQYGENAGNIVDVGNFGLTGNILPKISGDGNRIAFLSDLDPTLHPLDDLTRDNLGSELGIFLFDTARAAFSQITPSLGGAFAKPSTTGSGDLVSFVSFGNLTRRNSDGSAEVFLAGPAEELLIGDCGDLNGDTNINILDVIILMFAILGTEVPSESQLIVGDVNRDAALNVLDLVVMMQHLVGRTPILECL
jgi:Tol biopolymer transport system component